MVIFVMALAIMGFTGYKIYQKHTRTEQFFVKAKEMQQKADEAFKSGQNGQAKLYLDSCNYYLNLIEKVSGSR